MTVTQVIQRMRGMLEQAEDLLDQINDLPFMSRTSSWQWTALMVLRYEAVVLIAAYKTMQLSPARLNYESWHAIQAINAAVDKCGLPCEDPTPQDAQTWVWTFGDALNDR
jgi:hypothetical protein